MQNDWDATADHPMQSWAWGEFRRKMGITVERVHGWQVMFHSIPHTPLTVGYFPKGPNPTGPMLETLKALGKKHRAIYILLEPNVSANLYHISSNPQLLPSHHPLFTKYTFLLDLTKSEDELLKAMHPKTRYNIKVAAKRGVSITVDNSPRAFNAYLNLTQETTSRQGFYAHNPQYHKTMWQIMHEAGIASLWTASYDDEILAAWIIFSWKDTLYYPYGATSRNKREVMAPNLLLWEIARWGKTHGYRVFDLWGALGPNPDERDPWFGFHRFKAGYNPQLVEMAGSFDLILSPPLYAAYRLADTLRWILLKKR
jgi:lipid II:glycine glycyltransferase (peptidoglycan interpeptide bridge formation enzyme)